MEALYTILLPDKKELHKDFLDYVADMAGGWTLHECTEGKWLNMYGEYEQEIMWPLSIACNDSTMKEIAQKAKKHFNEKSIMYWKASSEIHYVI